MPPSFLTGRCFKLFTFNRVNTSVVTNHDEYASKEKHGKFHCYLHLPWCTDFSFVISTLWVCLYSLRSLQQSPNTFAWSLAFCFIVPQFTENTVTFRKINSSLIYSDLKPAVSYLPNPFVYLEAQEVSKAFQYIYKTICRCFGAVSGLHLQIYI